MHEQGDRGEEDRAQGEQVPGGDQGRAAGLELAQDLTGRPAEDVRVLEPCLEQRKASHEEQGNHDQEQGRSAANASGIHEPASLAM